MIVYWYPFDTEYDVIVSIEKVLQWYGIGKGLNDINYIAVYASVTGIMPTTTIIWRVAR